MRTVFRIARCRLVRGDMLVGGSLEGEPPRGLQTSPCAFLLARLERINAVDQQLASCMSFPPRLCQRHQLHRTKSHGARAPLDHVSKDPRLGERLGDVQPQATPVAMAARRGDRLNLTNCQLVYRPRHPGLRPLIESLYKSDGL